MAVLEELGSKLTDIAGIKVSFPLQNDKDSILKIYARLCLLYDETWDFGDASFSLSCQCKKILRLLNRVGIAHLTPTAADVVDPRRLPRVWSAFIAHLEQKYGSQGLYPRLRKVLKQQQILATRREAERERQQRMADSVCSPSKPQLGDISARSPSKLQLGDISTGSALSQDSQEDVRFAKPHPPLQKVRHASASSSGSAVSPSKSGIRSRIPVPTRPNLIPSGKQLARTPSLSVKSTAPAGPPHMIQVFGSPRLVAPKAAATLAAAAALSTVSRSPSSSGDQSDGAASESASSPDASPSRRRSLIPAAKSPEQALGEYIESRLNAGFPHEPDVAEPTATAASPAPSAPAATETTLNETYSAERPTAAPRAAGQAPSPAADAREAILQAAEDPADADDKENVRPADVEPDVVGKPADTAEDSTAAASGVRRDTFEVTPTPANPGQPASCDEDVPSSVHEEQSVADAAHKIRAKKGAAKGQSKETVGPAAEVTSVSESCTVTETVSDTTVDLAVSAPVQTAQESSSAPPEEPAKKRRARSKKDVHESECVDTTDQRETQAEASKKRGARANKVTAVAQDPLPAAEVAPASEIAPAPEISAVTAQESTADLQKTEAPKKRGGRAKRAKQAPSEDAPSSGVAELVAPAPEGDTAARAVTDTPVDAADQTKVSDSVPAEVQSVQVAAPSEAAPKKRRGRAKKEAKAVDETASSAESVPHVTANDAVQPEAVCSSVEMPAEAILKAAEDPADADDKENVRTADVEPDVVGKPADTAEDSTAAAGGVRRDTFEVTPTPANPGQPASCDEDVPSSVHEEQPVADAAHNIRAKKGAAKGQSKETVGPAAEVTSVSESCTVTETVSDTTVDLAVSAPVQTAQESSSAPPEEPAKKRRARSKKDVHESECADTTDQRETQAEASKKRGARAKKATAVAQDPLLTAEVAPASEIAPAPAISDVTAQESTADLQKTEAPKKRGGRAKRAKQAPSEDAPSSGVAELVAPAPEAGTAAQAVTDTPVDAADQPKVSDSAPAEAQPVQAAAPAEEAPKKRRGRAKKEAKAVDETASSAESVPHVTANDAVQPEAAGSSSVGMPQETAEIAAKEAPKKRRGRGKKDEKTVADLAEDVPSKSENAPLIDDTPATEPSVNQTDSGDFCPTEPAKTTEQEAPKRRRGRAREAKPAAAAGDTVPAVAESATAPAASESVSAAPESAPESAPAALESAPAPAAPESTMEQPQPAAELSEQAAKPAPVRASRRKTAERPQKSTGSETADDTDPTWTPNVPVTGARRGRRAARERSHPAETPEDGALSQPDPVAVRGRRTRDAETSAESAQTAEPSGGRAGRATRGSRTSTDPASDQSSASATTAARRSTRGGRKTPDQAQDSSEEPVAEPTPRRRRLRVVLESDSEGGTPPAPARADVSPSPAPPQRSRRTRKTLEDTGPPRRALRTLDNCN